MTQFLQTAIPVVLTALLAGQVAVTRTTRLQRLIRANVDLLGTLPADDASRAKLEDHIAELVDVLIRRQRRRFEPFTRAGVLFGARHDPRQTGGSGQWVGPPPSPPEIR